MILTFKGREIQRAVNLTLNACNQFVIAPEISIAASVCSLIRLLMKHVPAPGDFFHAAPNIDHSQDFVRKDIIEWMQWLRTDFGFDGWRLDFVRS